MKLAIAGAAGRMGQALIKKALVTPSMELVGGSVRPGSKYDAEQDHGVRLTSDMETLMRKSDAVLDFTHPKYSLEIAALAAKYEKIHVCGTTGFTPAQLAELKEHAAKARIVYSRNMSVGINLLLALVEKVGGVLGAEEWDIEVDEMHHKHKVDAPSGTALMLAEAAALGRGVPLDAVKTMHEFGASGPRRPGSIGFSVRRGGDVVGDHMVIFAGPGERLELSHKASSRDIYSAGAIRAALWAQDKKPGFYAMRDVLAL